MAITPSAAPAATPTPRSVRLVRRKIQRTDFMARGFTAPIIQISAIVDGVEQGFRSTHEPTMIAYARELRDGKAVA